ncbi:hypothetical protein GF369_00920 [Candidatus Peregrinibacteria bacterium]|nr:hypothetical protein [Candidatus Peregrinibacteria bacterium]
MKKIITITLLSLFILVGCGQEEPDPVVEELSNNHVGPSSEPFSNGPSELPGN